MAGPIDRFSAARSPAAAACEALGLWFRKAPQGERSGRGRRETQRGEAGAPTTPVSGFLESVKERSHHTSHMHVTRARAHTHRHRHIHIHIHIHIHTHTHKHTHEKGKEKRGESGAYVFMRTTC